MRWRRDAQECQRASKPVPTNALPAKARLETAARRRALASLVICGSVYPSGCTAFPHGPAGAKSYAVSQSQYSEATTFAWCFNSTLVRLRPLAFMLLQPLLSCFNSTLVRLRQRVAGRVETPRHRFQFHSGSIKTWL